LSLTLRGGSGGGSGNTVTGPSLLSVSCKNRDLPARGCLGEEQWRTTTRHATRHVMTHSRCLSSPCKRTSLIRNATLSKCWGGSIRTLFASPPSSSRPSLFFDPSVSSVESADFGSTCMSLQALDSRERYRVFNNLSPLPNALVTMCVHPPTRARGYARASTHTHIHTSVHCDMQVRTCVHVSVHAFSEHAAEGRTLEQAPKMDTCVRGGARPTESERKMKERESERERERESEEQATVGRGCRRKRGTCWLNSVWSSRIIEEKRPTI